MQSPERLSDSGLSGILRAVSLHVPQQLCSASSTLQCLCYFAVGTSATLQRLRDRNARGGDAQRARRERGESLGRVRFRARVRIRVRVRVRVRGLGLG